MSFKYNNAVQRVKPLSGHAARLVLWYLADHASDIGISYASYETLMDKCDIKGRDTVARVLKELVDLGIITRKARFKNCNKYILSMEAIQRHSLTVKLSDESEFDDQTIGGVTGDSGVARGSSGLAAPEQRVGGDSLIRHQSKFDETGSNSLISGDDSLITQTHSICLPSGKNSICTLPTVSGADAPSCVNDSISQTNSKTKSKAKATPSDSGTAVPEPQSGTSRPETHGGFVSQGRPRVPPPPADWKAPWEIAREKFASGEWEDLDDVAGDART